MLFEKKPCEFFFYFFVRSSVFLFRSTRQLSFAHTSFVICVFSVNSSACPCMHVECEQRVNAVSVFVHIHIYSIHHCIFNSIGIISWSHDSMLINASRCFSVQFSRVFLFFFFSFSAVSMCCLRHGSVMRFTFSLCIFWGKICPATHIIFCFFVRCFILLLTRWIYSTDERIQATRADWRRQKKTYKYLRCARAVK